MRDKKHYYIIRNIIDRLSDKPIVVSVVKMSKEEAVAYSYKHEGVKTVSRMA